MRLPVEVVMRGASRSYYLLGLVLRLVLLRLFAQRSVLSEGQMTDTSSDSQLLVSLGGRIHHSSVPIVCLFTRHFLIFYVIFCETSRLFHSVTKFKFMTTNRTNHLLEI